MKRLWLLLVVLPYFGIAQNHEKRGFELRQTEMESVISKVLNAYVQQSHKINMAMDLNPPHNRLHLMNSLDYIPLEYNETNKNEIIEIIPANYDPQGDVLTLDVSNLTINSGFEVAFAGPCPSHDGLEAYKALRSAGCITLSGPYYIKSDPSVVYLSPLYIGRR